MDSVRYLTSQYINAQRKMRSIRAQYEAAQTYPSNEMHWGKADNLSPDAVNNPETRATLRSRSRFEIVENNPFLNGALITMCNDFAGKGIRLRITDLTIPKTIREKIERQWRRWQKAIKLRKLLWQLRMDKVVAGEAFAVQVLNKKIDHPVQLDFRRIEADCVASPLTGEELAKNRTFAPSEVDGIRLDLFGVPIEYFVLDHHPGGFGILNDNQRGGKWIPASQMIHVFRAMRGWNRGVPELTPSLPLCAVLRRYTMALVKCAEVQACLAAVLESDIPSYRAMSPQVEEVEVRNPDGSVTTKMVEIDDDHAFETMPIEPSMLNILPQGMRLKNFDRVPVGQQFDQFAGVVIREIFRPTGMPYNMAIGCSKDANMASGVLDTKLYTQTQQAEREDFNDDVLEPMFKAWFELGCLTDGYFTERGKMPKKLRTKPDHEFSWDKVTVEHTDPTKIANSIAIQRESAILTDRFIQEEVLGKDYETYQAEMLEQAEFWKKIDEIRGMIPDQNAKPNQNGNQSKQKKKPRNQSSDEGEED